MQACKFKPGDRVVNTSFTNPHEGIPGTVVEALWHEDTPREVWPGVFEPGVWELIIILDTAERLTVRLTHNWVTEDDYRTGAYIPF